MSPEKSVSEPGPFHFPLFRAVWTATAVASLSVWVQNVGAAWLMTSLTASPLMIALIQAATTMPAFLFGMPAGVLADSMEKRRLLMGAYCWMLAFSALLCFLLMWDAIDPIKLLLITFMLGIGSAISVPAWQSSTAEAVPRTVMLSAIALNGVAFNGARAVGPALAGAIIAGLGSHVVFVVTTSLFAVAMFTLMFWYKPGKEATLNTEPMFSAMRSGLRYVFHSPVLCANLARTFVFVSCASALWALLPLVAKQHSAFGAKGYGTLLASLGTGAVAGGIALGRLRSHVSLNTLATGSSIVFAVATVVAARVPHMVPVCVCLFAGGAAWITFNSTLSSAFQTTLPPWVRARALAVFLLTFQGSMALGALLWGTCADHFGVTATLVSAALLMGVGQFLFNGHPLRMGSDSEVTPSRHRPSPAVEANPSPQDGPVAVQVDYRVPRSGRTDFTNAVYTLGKSRRRDGARHWRLYRDLANDDCFVERFIVDSWGEYLRQGERATEEDRKVEETLRSYLTPGCTPLVSHFVAEPYPRAAKRRQHERS